MSERDGELSSAQQAQEEARAAKAALAQKSDTANKDSDKAVEALNAEKSALKQMLEPGRG